MRKWLLIFVAFLFVYSGAYASTDVLAGGWWNASEEELLLAQKQIDEVLIALGHERPVERTKAEDSNRTDLLNRDKPIYANENFIVVAHYHASTLNNEDYSFVLKNISGTSCRFVGTLYYKDDQDETIGAEKVETGIVEDGQEIFFTCVTTCKCDHFGFDLKPESTAEEGLSGAGIQSSVEMKAIFVDDKTVILCATNIGGWLVSEINYHMLYMDEYNNCLRYAWGRMVDGSIAPGDTVYKELPNVARCDHVMIWVE